MSAETDWDWMMRVADRVREHQRNEDILRKIHERQKSGAAREAMLNAIVLLLMEIDRRAELLKDQGGLLFLRPAE